MADHAKKRKPVNEETLLTAKRKRKKRKGSAHNSAHPKTLLTGL